MHSIKLSGYKRGIKFENCLLGVTNIVKNNDKDKWVYSGYGITFDGGDWRSFGNSTARNAIIFGVYSSSSSHVVDNFLILGKGPTFGINGSSGLPEKKIGINLNKANTKFCLSLHYNADNS